MRHVGVPRPEQIGAAGDHQRVLRGGTGPAAGGRDAGAIPRLLKAGLCVGFSDPVSNIVVNTVSSSSRRVPERKKPAVMTPVSDEPDDSVEGRSKRKAAAAKRRRRRALSRAVADTGNVKHWPPWRHLLRDMPVATRSLEALVAFLTYYFRYLPAHEALEYLRLANADLLLAVRLVEEDRNSSGSFSFASQTTKTAIKCAALAACHPKPRALVNRSYSLASRMEQVSQLLATEGGCLSCTAIENISALMIKPRRKLRGLAGVTPPQFHLELNRPPPFVPTKSLQSVQGAGHCYSPFMDPVSNIVLNTVWYDTMLPTQEELSVAMICSRSLVLVACRSLRGLVAYLRACFDTFSEHQAMRYLLLTEVNLWGAIDMARQQGHPEITMLTQDDAYRAAATAAMHPNP
ncbi:hypothetical protein BAE44_0006423 [Dichanthelium oligosanthes]|uniref:PIR2-like helical domain-containing protein n=1 Tax=Dichanthelium oligosanthes TaxID=888268 RepID=A0A1E5W5C8_9POAL|nr:hypothetical protein BAE44_0006423 [Dichanthelium oligosanthes]